MRFVETDLNGLWIVDPAPFRDDRGAFTRTFCEREFASRGLVDRFVQHSHSLSLKCGTRRGLHYQAAPHVEAKLVSCIAGRIWDVAVDLRRDSPTRGAWRAVELSAANGRQIYIPAGFAHGFQSLTDDAVTSYLISAFFAPEAARGIRHDDSALAITWPCAPSVISTKDQSWPRLADATGDLDGL